MPTHLCEALGGCWEPGPPAVPRQPGYPVQVAVADAAAKTGTEQGAGVSQGSPGGRGRRDGGDERLPWRPYLPSPPQAPLGVISTSRQSSVSVLYTYIFSSWPSYSSTTENRSWLWSKAQSKSAVGDCPWMEAPLLYLRQQRVPAYDVVALGSQTGQSCGGIRLHFLDTEKYVSRQQAAVGGSLYTHSARTVQLIRFT